MDGSHHYGDARRDAAEREMFVVAAGAGVQNFLVALSGERSRLGVGLLDDVLP